MAVFIIHSNFNNSVTEKVLKPEKKSNKSIINISTSEHEKRGMFPKKLFKKFKKL